jgi:hypothetical protein
MTDADVLRPDQEVVGTAERARDRSPCTSWRAS